MARRRRSFRLRSAPKILKVWAFLCLVALIYWIKSLVGEGQDAIAVVNEFAFSILPIFALVFLTIAVVVFFAKYRARKINREIFPIEKPDFAFHPANYDKEVVHVFGKIVRVLEDESSEKLKRKLTDIVRTATKNPDQASRFIHQRFFISSPQLKSGENIIVFNNEKYNKLKLKKGYWVLVKGEYVHSVSRKRTAFGWKDNFYGLIHHTHPPEGDILVFEDKYKLAEYLKISL
jgi:hypothetical protein